MTYKLKTNAAGKSDIEEKLEELSRKSNFIPEPLDETLLIFELHDKGAPLQIAEVLNNPNSTTQDKHIATLALWILSENFAGNCKFKL